jgi:hypothetical protein
LEDGASAEIAIVGNDGVLGISVFMGGETTPDRAVVQNEGWGYRISALHLKTEFERGGPVTMLLLRYVQVLMTQIPQTAVCNRHHGIDQQFFRWLLMCLDRTDTNTLTMTDDLIADMLGVGLEGVKDTIGKLQSAEYIRYSRGRITAMDRPGLENQSASAMPWSSGSRSACCWTLIRASQRGHWVSQHLIDAFKA